MRPPTPALIELTKAEGLCGAVHAELQHICTLKAGHQPPHMAVLSTANAHGDVVVADCKDPN